MNVLVTGATGFIGSHLCKTLVREGHQVFGLSRTGRKVNVEPLLREKSFQLILGDIQDTEAMLDLISDNRIKAVFHLAAQLPGDNDIDTPFLRFDTDARGTLSMLHAAHRGQVEDFIYASSMSVYSEPPQRLPVDEDHQLGPPTIYGVAKLAGEFCSRVYADRMNTTILRYSGAYGQGERESNAVYTFIHQALDNQTITIFGNGEQTSDFVLVDDVVRGTILAWERHASGVYNIGSGEETSIKQLAELIICLTGSTSQISLIGTDTDRPFRFYLDISKARQELGYSPILLDRGLRIYLGELGHEVKI